MRILGIDSSSPDCSVALLDNQKILAQRRGSRRSSFSDQLLPMVDEVLSSAGTGLDNVDGFAVATGPGSFTGLRVGLSLIKGFILATEKPFASVDTLEAMAALVPPTNFAISVLICGKITGIPRIFSTPAMVTISNSKGGKVSGRGLLAGFIHELNPE